jgi:hypothetical protein
LRISSFGAATRKIHAHLDRHTVEQALAIKLYPPTWCAPKSKFLPNKPQSQTPPLVKCFSHSVMTACIWQSPLFFQKVAVICTLILLARNDLQSPGTNSALWRRCGADAENMKSDAAFTVPPKNVPGGRLQPVSWETSASGTRSTESQLFALRRILISTTLSRRCHPLVSIVHYS